MFQPTAKYIHGTPLMIDYTAGLALIAAGAVLLLSNSRLGIAHQDIQPGTLGAVSTGGCVYDVLNDGAAVTDHADVFWINQPLQAPSSITQSAGTATVTVPAAHHLVVGQSVTIAGCSQAGYNGQFVVASVPSSTTFTVAVPSATVSPATAAAGLVITSASNSGGLSTPNAYNAIDGTANTFLGIADGATAAGTAGTTATRVIFPIPATSVSQSETTVPYQSIAAAGSTQTNGAALIPGFNMVTGADGTKGVILPAAGPGTVISVKNADAANAILKVYPNTAAGTINALSAGAAISMAVKTACDFMCQGGDVWVTIPLVPS